MPQKIGEKDGKERFVLLDADTQRVITVKDVSEQTLRRYLAKKVGAENGTIDEALRKARKRYEKAMSETTEEFELDEMMAEISLEEDLGDDLL